MDMCVAVVTERELFENLQTELRYILFFVGLDDDRIC